VTAHAGRTSDPRPAPHRIQSEKSRIAAFEKPPFYGHIRPYDDVTSGHSGSTMTASVSLLFSSRAELEGTFGGATEKARPVTAWDVYSDPQECHPLVEFVVLAGGEAVGAVTLRKVPPPDALAGTAAELGIAALSNADPTPWLASALIQVSSFAERVLGLSDLVVTPVTNNSACSAAFIKGGFVGPNPNARYHRALVSAGWRRKGVFIIAEAGSNWRMGTLARDMAMAKALIDVAAEAGADAVKFQTFRPETTYVAEAGSSDYLSEVGITQTIQEIFADIAMPYDMLPQLAEQAHGHGIEFMSTAFSAADFAAVDPLVSVHKIASYEISHLRLIELAARSGKPTVMSTGAATLNDVAWAVDHFRSCGGRDLCLMQCTAKYPAPLDALNLATIPELGRMFNVSVGLSDHSRDPAVGPLAATALGARVIEKHFTLDNRLPGPDHPFALTATELAQLVTAVRAATTARGDGIKDVLDAEAELAAFAQRGLQAIAEIRPGDLLTEDGNIAILRPGKQAKGIHPRYLLQLAGKRATRRLKPGEGLREGDWTNT
jgi:N-acetylneuraminate synthase